MLLFLASNSPRRKHLISLGGWEFTALPADVDESVLPGETPQDYVLRLAESKARTVAALVPPEAVIVAADTTVVDVAPDGRIDLLGKPADASEAEVMLRRLRGRTHQVYTALAALRHSDGAFFLDCCVTDVPMRPYSDAEIRAYIATGDPLDKAGAYAIQHPDFHPVDLLEGCYANVVGLPLCHLTRTLRKLGIVPRRDIPRACQAALEYHCLIFNSVLGSA